MCFLKLLKQYISNLLLSRWKSLFSPIVSREQYYEHAPPSIGNLMLLLAMEFLNYSMLYQIKNPRNRDMKNLSFQGQKKYS